MNRSLFYLGSTVMGLSMLFCSCSQSAELGEPTSGSIPDAVVQTPIVLHYSIDKTQPTRSASQTLQTAALDSRSSVGITFVDSASSTVPYTNVLYDVGEDELLSPNSSVTNPPVVAADQQLSAIGYLPYQEQWTELKEYDFEVQKDQTLEADYLASDLIWGKIDGITAENVSQIDMPMRRRLARWKINVKLTDGQKISDFRGARFAVYGIKRSTTINLANGEVPAEASGALRVISYLTVPEDATGDAQLSGMLLIPPQTIDSDQCFLRVTFKDGVKLYFSFRKFSFKAHTAYTSTVILHAYENSYQAIISDFEENPDVSGDLIAE